MQSRRMKRMRDIFTFLVFLTSSFDLFLCVEIKGYNFRIAQLLTVGVYALAIADWVLTKQFKPVMGLSWLIGFVILNIVFTFNTVLPKWNLLYDFWLVTLLLLVVSVNQLYHEERERLLELYLWSFACMACLGIIQFIYALCGWSQWMIIQTWSEAIPRINGFCYEPSYYSTYLVVGWFICSFLLMYRQRQLRSCPIRLFFMLISVALVLSSSRMVFIPVLAWIVFVFIRTVVISFREKKTDGEQLLTLGLHLTIPLLLWAYSQLAEKRIGEGATTSVLLGTIGTVTTDNIDWRLNGWLNTWKVFLKSPLIGCGLGGVNAQVGVIQGLSIPEIEATGRGLSGNIFLEMLAATGIAGGICFLMYGWQVLRQYLKADIGKPLGIFQRAVIVAFLAECFMLAMNQNMLRIYFWCAISVMTAFADEQGGAISQHRFWKKKP